MKQLVKYLRYEGNGAEPSDIKVGPNVVTYSKADQASEEWRLTLALHELPEEVG